MPDWMTVSHRVAESVLSASEDQLFLRSLRRECVHSTPASGGVEEWQNCESRGRGRARRERSFGFRQIGWTVSDFLTITYMEVGFTQNLRAFGLGQFDEFKKWTRF